MDALLCLDTTYSNGKLDLDNLPLYLGKSSAVAPTQKRKELAQMLNQLDDQNWQGVDRSNCPDQTINPDEFKERMLSTIKTAAFGQKIDLAREISLKSALPYPRTSESSSTDFFQVKIKTTLKKVICSVNYLLTQTMKNWRTQAICSF